jgi:hypothetical protein
MLKLTSALTFALLICIVFTLAYSANAQSLSIGQVKLTNGTPYPCSEAANGKDFFTGMSCLDATITGCPNVSDIGITYGYIGPANPQGTVVFFSGGKGTTPTEEGDDILTYAPVYEGNFEIIQIEYQTPWEDPSANGSGGNILNAACRPATFLNYVYYKSGLLMHARYAAIA